MDDGHLVAPLGPLELETLHNAGDLDLPLVFTSGKVLDKARGKPVDLLLETVQGMPGNIKPQALLFTRQPLRFRPFRDVRQFQEPPGDPVLQGQRSEDIELIGVVIGPADPKGVIEPGKEPRPVFPGKIKRPALDEAFQDPPVDLGPIHPPAEVEQIAERSMPVPFLDDQLHRLEAHILDRGQPEPDLPIHHGKIRLAFVHIRGKDLDPHGPAFGDVLDGLVLIPHVLGQEGGHKLDRIMGLEIGGLIGDHGIGRGMRLVEPIPPELVDQPEELLGHLRRDPVTHGPFHKLGAMLRHQLGLLFSHGLAKLIGLSHGIAGQDLGDLHDLFLIQYNPVGLLQDRLQRGQEIVDLSVPMLAIDEVVDHVAPQRSRPVKGHEGDHVFKDLGSQPSQEVLHARTFQLKNAGGLSIGAELVGRFIRKGDLSQVDRLPRGLFNKMDGLLDDRQGLKPQEIELDEAQLFNPLHGELGHDFTLVPAVEREVFHQRPVRNHHAAGMGGCMAGQSLQGTGYLQEFFARAPALLQASQFGLVPNGIIETDPRAFGHQLGDAVHLSQGDIEAAAHIPNDPPGLHGPERDDLADVFLAVFFRHIADDLVPAVDAEIDIDIRHADTGRIEEPLKEEPILDRLDVGDVETESR